MSASLSDDQGFSLEDLSRAYAHLVHGGADPYEPLPSTSGEPTAVTDIPPDEQTVAADQACELSPASILEAMLFVGHPENRPLESREVAGLMRGVRPQEVDEMVRELNAAYESERCPYLIRAVGAGYCLELREEFHRLRDKVSGRVRAARLSQPAVDVLAIVAYNQPVTRETIDQVRGRPSGAILAQLVRRQLIRLERVTQDGKRRSQYRTTDRFLALFGLSGLAELPQGQDPDRSSGWS